MKAALFLTLGSLLGSTFAIHARHANFHKKRGAAPPPLDYACCKSVVTVTVYADEGMYPQLLLLTSLTMSDSRA
jgi:hypothetical protein